MNIKLCKRCGKTKPVSEFHKSRSSKTGAGAWCKLCNRERNNVRNRALRIQVLNHYGGKCACCGESRPEFLSLDHVNGGGRQHRKTVKIRWWEWLRKNNYPSGFRVLCHNCNQSIGIYGYCPHQTDVSRLRDAFEAYDENAPSKSYKLTKAQVKEIRKEIASGTAQNKLALEYKVSRATICFINKGKRWADA